MLNENGNTALEIYEDWEVEEFVNDAEAMGIVDAFVYTFKQGGREVTGLTARAIEEICLLAKPRVSISASNVTDEGDTVFAEATAMAKYVVPATKQTLPDGTVIETEGYEEVVTADGVRRENAYLPNGKRDPHAEQKVLTKAMRAARRQLISQAAQIQAKEYLLKKQGGKPASLPQGVVPPKRANGNRQQTANPNAKVMEACFEAFGKQEEELAFIGVNKKKFWETLKGVLNVQSRDDMTEQQWKDVTRDLETMGYGEIVRDVLVKCGVNLAELEEPERV